MFEKEMNDICNSAFYTKEELVKDNRKLLEYIEQYKQALLDIKEYIKNNTHKTQWGDLEQDNEDIDINEDKSDTEFITELLDIINKALERK